MSCIEKIFNFYNNYLKSVQVIDPSSMLWFLARDVSVISQKKKVMFIVGNLFYSKTKIFEDGTFFVGQSMHLLQLVVIKFNGFSL